jgi:hypothetical protein
MNSNLQPYERTHCSWNSFGQLSSRAAFSARDSNCSDGLCDALHFSSNPQGALDNPLLHFRLSFNQNTLMDLIEFVTGTKRYHREQEEKREKAFQESLKERAYQEYYKKYPFTYFPEKRNIPPPPPLPESRKEPSVWIDYILKPLFYLSLRIFVWLPCMIIAVIVLFGISAAIMMPIMNALSSEPTAGGLSALLAILFILWVLADDPKK